MINKNLKLETLKDWLCRDLAGRERLSKSYKNISLRKRIQVNSYSFIND